MAKSLDAPYEAGNRGASWLKIKRAHTLDLIVLAAEWGHGRRSGKLSNLHLGALDPATGEYVMLGKTFKGLTDAMLDWQTGQLLSREVRRDPWTVYVRPELVVEIAFSDLQASTRYPGGLALRLARGKRYPDDSRALGKSPPHAYQVWRQDFDRMLYAHARECGADTREGHEAIGIEQLGPRDSRLEVRTEEGRGYRIEARYVVDASGRDAFLAAKRRLRRKNAQHQSAAIFGHFRGADVRPGEDAGNISMYRFEHGWMWMIPLPDGVMSVGAVCWPDYLKQRRGRTLEFLLETLRRNPALWQRMRRAELIGNEVRVTGNYSYDSSSMGGPGWVLIGDAFAFIDPVFSSGVYLAMSGAEQAARVG